MFSQRVRSVMERKKLLTAAPQTTVSQAAKLMAKKNVGAVMVVEGERLVGIFTERDALTPSSRKAAIRKRRDSPR